MDVDFLYLSSQSGLDESVDAIIGFARPNEKMLLAPEQQLSSSTYFLQALEDAGEPTFFSTRFQMGFVSWIDIGSPDVTQQTSTPVKLACLDDYFWSHTN